MERNIDWNQKPNVSCNRCIGLYFGAYVIVVELSVFFEINIVFYLIE